MTKTTPITYYASLTLYFSGGKKATKYLVHADHTTYERIGNLESLKNLGASLSAFYKNNISSIKFHNCTEPLLERNIYRKLTFDEKKVFLEALTGTNISEIKESIDSRCK
jgi:hypothetical protein